MEAVKFLQQQGIGSRKECRLLLAAGRVALDGRVLLPADDVADDFSGSLSIDHQTVPTIVAGVRVLVLNKPAGYEVSHRPMHHPSVYRLLPENLVQAGFCAVGRLDADTTGVLLFTRDGVLNHRLTSPKHHAEKEYCLTLKHAADEDFCRRLESGVALHGDGVVRAHKACLVDAYHVHMVLFEGKYHQVKRMAAAAGNRVIALHRSVFAGVDCDGLPEGSWRWLPEFQVA